MNTGDDIQRITPGMAQYPALLKEIKGYPRELFCIGDTALLQKRCVAVVGSRRTNSYGRSVAVKISKSIASAGLVVVSGMASGIDTCAHRGALDAQGGTIAVLGCGIDICYPAENGGLKKEIEQKGLIVSEYGPGMKPKKYFFPQRNRIISGLSEVTVVAQAGNSSGALITADLAGEQGREVCAVPGNIDSSYNMGSNKLIRDGAFPLLNPADILDMLGVCCRDREEIEKLMSSSELKIYNALESTGEATIDELCMMLSKPPSYVAGMVTIMEMKGLLFSDIGKIFIAKT